MQFSKKLLSHLTKIKDLATSKHAQHLQNTSKSYFAELVASLETAIIKITSQKLVLIDGIDVHFVFVFGYFLNLFFSF